MAIRDVFYYGKKPNAHPRERHALTLADARTQSTTEHFWIINEFCDYRKFDWDFDFDLLPDEDIWAEDHNNVWPSQHQKDSGTWLCPKVAGDYTIYRTDVPPVQRKNEINDFWIIDPALDKSRFDFSWHPDPTSPPYIYQFGTLLDENDGPRYVTPDNDGTRVHLERKEVILEDLEFSKYYINTTLEDLINDHTNEIFWALNPEIDYSGFDFKWVPDSKNVYHINAFGTKDNINSQTYFVNGKMWARGYRDINYIEDKVLDVRTKIDIFFVDKGNPQAQERFQQLSERMGNVTKTRYLNSWVDTINRCVTKSTTNLCWILNSELDYSSFEFDFYPSPWQMNLVHVFGTQWSHWGTTFMVNKNTFADDTKYIKVIEHLPNLNFVKRSSAKAVDCLYAIVIIDHGNGVDTVKDDLLSKNLSERNIITVKYDTNYLKTFKEVLGKLDVNREHYVWICSSVCDYSRFDFSYICDPYTKEQLHVFPSGNQKLGDTFLVNVNKLRKLIADMHRLEDYEKINYNQHQVVSRLMTPTTTEGAYFPNETHMDYARNYEWDFPYVTLVTDENWDMDPEIDPEPMCLWSPEQKAIIISSTGATRVTIPREAKNYVKSELYDYPYIKRAKKLTKSKPMDIVYLSNGEAGAEKNWEHLLQITKNIPNRVVRVDGVNGRVAAYHAAAEASETPWLFTVFAKLHINSNFDWSWQPDRMQAPKHYIFHAKNPVNGLIYGHQAMIAYNKQLVLENDGYGLDFTLDDLHEVVPLMSGTANYNTDPFSTWRTAFREVVKLKAEDTDIARERLEAWLTKAEGDFAEYSIKGAKDAEAYYDEVDGDFDALRLSYEWEWLKSRFVQKYG